MSALFDPIFGMAEIRAITGDAAWLRSMYQVEGVLALACGEVGLISPTVTETIVQATVTLSERDPAEFGGKAAADANPVLEVVARLRRELTAADDASPAQSLVHLGATSQDIIDTAAMMICAEALDLLASLLTAAADAVASLAKTHRDTLMVARTLMQQAVPTTFGLVATSWGLGLDSHRHQIQLIRKTLAVQYGGAGGTSASIYPHGRQIRRLMAAFLALEDPGCCWHTERSRITNLAGVLGAAAATIGAIANSVVLYAQTEVAEVSESSGGGSSAMPQKQNPVAAITARANAMQAPGLVSTLLSAALSEEHQRAAGGWHAEWPSLMALLTVTVGAANRLAESLQGLAIHPDQMLANLMLTNGLVMTERVNSELTKRSGKQLANDSLRRAIADPDGFKAGLLHLEFSLDEVDRWLDPRTYLGNAADDVDRYLKARKSEQP